MARKSLSCLAMAPLMAVTITACSVSETPTSGGQQIGGMPMTGQSGRMGETSAGPSVPPVKGYGEGQEILFLHTEASDPNVAKLLTDMMGSPVLVVPSLSHAAPTMLANVFVFTNGIKGDGPMGFQSDVFDRVPEDPGYTPLRALHLVTWMDERAARELKSATEVQAAASKGEVTISRSGAVINMPFVTWPGGHR